MGAHYHVLVPYKIAIQNHPNLQAQFDQQFGADFTLQKEVTIERLSPPLSGGKRLNWTYIEKQYVLSEATIRKEFLEFSQLLYHEWRRLYQTKFKGKIPFNMPTQDELAQLLPLIQKEIDQYPLDSDALENALHDLEDNYSVRMTGIYPQVVYNGYPLQTEYHSSLMALDFLHSYEKMGVYPDEHVALYLLVDRMHEKYGQSFKMAKYLLLAGY